MPMAFAKCTPEFPDGPTAETHRSVTYLGYVIDPNGERRHGWICTCGLVIWDVDLEAAKKAA